MKLQPISRRSFLRIGATCTAVTTAAVMSGCSWVSGEKKETNATDFGILLVMDNTQATTLFNFAQTILPSGNGFPDIKTAKVINRADEEFYFVENKIQNDFKTMLDVMEYLPIFYGEFSRFSKMSNKNRLTFLNSLNDTTNETVRAVVNNCRMICYNMYYGHESTWQSIGYDGPYSKRPQVMSEQRKHYAKLVKEK